MISAAVETPPITSLQARERNERRRTMWVFCEWCLTRETRLIKPFAFLALAIVLAGVCSAFGIADRWRPGRGREMMSTLICMAGLVIFAGATGHAAQAICWETGRELRDLMRLTGIGSSTLLWCKTLARWWTIALSLLLLVPFALFAVTLGGVTADLLVAGGLWLFMFATLMSGMAQLAGVSANDTDNTAATLGFVTWGFLVLYHIPFGGTAAVVNLICWRTTGQTPGAYPGSWWNAIFDTSIELMPMTGVHRALSSPGTFSALNPRYWIHFVAAFGCYWVASVALAGRFRPNDGEGPAPTDASAARSVAAAKRPRCGSRPFFWKDAHILGGGRSTRTNWSIVYVLAAVGALITAHRLHPDSGWRLAMGIIAVCYMPIVIAMRFDVLLAAEFKQQTWSSLILLPIDRRVLLWSKLLAVASEQRWVLLPVGIATVLAARQQPGVVLMVAVIGVLMGVILCQMSALNHLVPKAWWIGPTQAFAAISLIVLCLVVWMSNEPWVSFVLTVAVMLVAILPAQWLVDQLLRAWTEA